MAEASQPCTMVTQPPMMDAHGEACVRDSDEEVIRRLARNDLEALEELYRRYARPVYSLALRVLGDGPEAEEVTQDVFERAWRHARSYDPERGRAATWLLSMTHHLAIDVLRKKQRRPHAVGGEAGTLALELVADPGVDVAHLADERWEGGEIRRALGALPDVQRQAIELAFFGGMSHMEIAAMLGDPLGTVKARIRRGMERLRMTLGELARDRVE